jgi:enolase-phosphatase E1
VISFQGHGILLDIEGTTSSVSFVYDVMFPFAKNHTADYVRSHWGEEGLLSALEYLAKDAGEGSFQAWCGNLTAEEQQEKVIAEALRQMELDAKATGLKQLQGLVWKLGFDSGELLAHVFDDVPPALKHWHASGIELRIYSSGSVGAQKLFFGHTVAGNLLELFSGHYDTTIGGKKESSSYHAIAEDLSDDAGQWLFISDIPAELDAAAAAGFQIALSQRPGNAEVPDADRFPSLTSFDQVQVPGQTHGENRR